MSAVTTVTAPITTELRSQIKQSLAAIIASSSVRLPEHGCDQMDLALVESSLNGEAQQLLRQIPSANRQGDLAIAIMRAVELRKR